MAKEKTVKKVIKKTAPKKASSEKPVKRATARKSTAKPTVKKTAAKPAARKATAKKTVKKVVEKKVTGKAAKKTVAKKAVKRTVKKTVVKKAARKVAKKTVVKKVVKKTMKKTVAEKVIKPIARKAVANKEVEIVQENLASCRAFGSYDGILLCDNPKIFPEKSPYSEQDLAKLRQMLEERRRHLLEVLREIDELMFKNTSENNKHVPTGYTTHLVENAVENTGTETALLVRQEEEQTLIQVDAAIERMDSGLFGVCLACAVKIGMPRLRAKPEAHLCIKCKQKYDKESSRRR